MIRLIQIDRIKLNFTLDTVWRRQRDTQDRKKKNNQFRFISIQYLFEIILTFIFFYVQNIESWRDDDNTTMKMNMNKRWNLPATQPFTSDMNGKNYEKWEAKNISLTLFERFAYRLFVRRSRVYRK